MQKNFEKILRDLPIDSACVIDVEPNEIGRRTSSITTFNYRHGKSNGVRVRYAVDALSCRIIMRKEVAA